MTSVERRIHNTLLRSCKEGIVPNGHYGPTTCRWATSEETEAFGLTDVPLVHLDHNGRVDCYFTETNAVVVSPKH